MDGATVCCPRCNGSRIEPSVATSIRDWCLMCEGAGRLKGCVPSHPISWEVFRKALTSD